MDSILSVEALTGGYSLRKPVIHELGFEVQPGEMVGLIGLNGAGKSTTIKHLLGLMQPHEGVIRIEGKTLIEAPESYRAATAYVPESPILYDELTVYEHLELNAMAYGLTPQVFADRAGPLIKEFQMEERKDVLSGHLSKGMRQKVMIMNAFLVQPKLYIIDEPFLGLDPLGIRSLLELMVDMKERGASILMSSHILSTIERYCDKYIVLHRGRRIAYGTLEELRETAGLRSDASLEDIFYTLVKGGSRL
jgi:ABC-2 type transport system ATP-binding protein